MLEEELKRILVDECGVEPESIRLDAELREDLGLDSLDMVRIIMAIESSFNVGIPDEEFAHVVTVGDALGVIRLRVA